MFIKQIVNIAHRGNFNPEGPIPTVKDKYEIPENTLEAFERAFQNGWGIETDIRLAGDGDFVVIHDGDIVRFSGQEGIIDQMTVTQIQAVDYKNKSGFQIPTLDALCELAQRYTKDGEAPFIAFQLKRGSDPESGVKVGRAIAQRMQKFDLTDSIIFDATIEEAEVLRAEYPWLNLSVSVGEKKYSDTIYTVEEVESERFKKAFNGIWADEWTIPNTINTKETFQRLRDAYPKGRIDVISPELHYDHDHPLSREEKLPELIEFWKEVKSWNLADGICTDYPTKLQEVL